jgi:mannitol/fructose-specific phosphotransferase system IIA component (Ntr-type)
MLLSEIFNVQHIKVNLESKTKDEAFEELIETVVAMHPELNRRDLLEAVIMREKQMHTAVAPGVAIPHGYCRTLDGMVGAIGISRAGIAYDMAEGETVHCIFMVFMNHERRETHLAALSKLAKLLDSQILMEMRAAASAQELNELLRRFEQTGSREAV